MKAVIINQYGSPEVLEEKEWAEPVINSKLVRIKVYATSVNPLDYKIRRGDFKLLTGKDRPKLNILGFDLSGEVIEVGPQVTRFKKGDRVFAMSDIKFGGGNAEIAVLPESYLAHLPTRLNFQQGAGVPVAALTAYQAFKYKGSLCMGESVLINGASGGVGTFAVQIAKAMGAAVTAVCSEKNMDQVSALGADQVINYEKESFLTNYNAYDMVFDVVGNLSLKQCQNCLTPFGYYVTTQPSLKLLLKSSLLSFLPGKKESCIMVKPRGEDLEAIGLWIQKEKIKPAIDRIFPLKELGDAHTYLESQRQFGKVIVTVQDWIDKTEEVKKPTH